MEGRSCGGHELHVLRGVRVSQRGRRVDIDTTGPGRAVEDVSAQVVRILSLDVDAGVLGEVTRVNVFTVDPARQTKLVDALDKATREIFVTLRGFISANLHSSLDGTRVINYAQWASEQQYAEALQRADVREHLAESAAIADSGTRPSCA